MSPDELRSLAEKHKAWAQAAREERLKEFTKKAKAFWDAQPRFLPKPKELPEEVVNGHWQDALWRTENVHGVLAEELRMRAQLIEDGGWHIFRIPVMRHSAARVVTCLVGNGGASGSSQMSPMYIDTRCEYVTRIAARRMAMTMASISAFRVAARLRRIRRGVARRRTSSGTLSICPSWHVRQGAPTS